MKGLRSFQDANKALARFVSPPKETKYKLDRMRKLMDFLGNPQNMLKIVHVAGTSGKTSTCYYVAALLRTAGYKVGHTVSPHVSEVNERLQINLIPLPEPEFCHELDEFLELIAKSSLRPSYFELLVALVYWEFAKQNVDYAVIEVGLGGLLDGTNVIDRKDKVCVITDIGLDHVNVLGQTLTQIAAQKAGIIQAKNVVFSYKQTPEVNAVFEKRCQIQQATLNLIKSRVLLPELDFLPLFQQRNFGLAMKAVNYVLERDGHALLDQQQLLEAAQVLIPARMEIFSRGDKIIILDGAHNAQKLHALAESIKAKFPGKKVAAMASFVDGRGFRLQSSLKELANLTNTLIITAFNSGQDLPYGAVEPSILAHIARSQGFAIIETINNPRKAFAKLLERSEPVLLVTGSFFIMNEVRPLAQKL